MYDLDYVLYEKNKLVEVRCMRCNVPVRIKAAGTLTAYNGTQIEACTLFELPNISKGKPILIEDANGNRSYIEPILCKDCTDKELDADLIIEQVKRGWKRELEAMNKPEEVIAEFMEQKGKIRRAQ